MVGELMTLPLRAGVRVTRFALNTTLTVSARALTLAGDVLQSLTAQHEDAPRPPQRRENGAAPDESPSRAPTQTPPKRAPASRARTRPEPTAETPPQPVDVDVPRQAVAPEPETVTPDPEPLTPEPEPAHVSEEPELVAEVAESGAEDGAGASVTVDEPWEGYAHLSAKDVVDRVANADAAELAAIQLFESTHRQRETVLAAVTRELRRENASARPDRPH